MYAEVLQQLSVLCTSLAATGNQTSILKILVVSKSCVGLSQLEDLKTSEYACHLPSLIPPPDLLALVSLAGWVSAHSACLSYRMSTCSGLLWLLLPFKWHSETNCCSGKEKTIPLYCQPGCSVEGVTLTWQIPHFAKNTGSKLSFTLVFAVPPLTKYIFFGVFCQAFGNPGCYHGCHLAPTVW